MVKKDKSLVYGRRLAALFRAFVVGIMLLAAAACDDEKNIDYSDLPGNARSFIETYFRGSDITSVVRDKDDGRKDYKVKLSDGSDIEFDENGNWTSIECHFSSLPDGILQPVVVSKIKELHPNAFIHSVDKERGGYKIEVTSSNVNWDMYFNDKGDFIREIQSNLDYDD